MFIAAMWGNQGELFMFIYYSTLIAPATPFEQSCRWADAFWFRHWIAPAVVSPQA
jgi:hypothetical protein